MPDLIYLAHRLVSILTRLFALNIRSAPHNSSYTSTF